MSGSKPLPGDPTWTRNKPGCRPVTFQIEGINRYLIGQRTTRDDVPIHSLRSFSERHVGVLFRKLRREFLNHGFSVRTQQGQIFPLGIQSKIRVEAFSWCRVVLARGKHHQASTRRECRVRKHPPLHPGRIVGERPTLQGYRHAIGIMDLDPVTEFAILINQDGLVFRHDFRDDRRRPSFGPGTNQTETTE